MSRQEGYQLRLVKCRVSRDTWRRGEKVEVEKTEV